MRGGIDFNYSYAFTVRVNTTVSVRRPSSVKEKRTHTHRVLAAVSQL